MSDIAERGVKFIFLAEASPQAKAQLDQWAKQITSAQAAVIDQMTKGVDAAAAAAKKSVEVVASAGGGGGAAGGGAAATAVAETRTANADLQKLYEERNRIKQAQADRELEIEKELWEELKVARQKAMSAEEGLREFLANGEEITKAERKMIDGIIDEWQRYEKQWIALQERKTKKAEQESTRQLNAQIRDAERAQRAAEREAERATQTRAREYERQTALAERSSNQVGQSARALMSNFTEATESVMRFARGIVAAGLVGEKELPKITDALLKMQSIMDITSGGIRALMKVEQMYQNIRTAILAALAAQQALTAAQAAGAARGATAAGVGMAGNAAAGAAGGLAGGALAARVGAVAAGTTAAGTAIGQAAVGSGIVSSAGAGGGVIAAGTGGVLLVAIGTLTSAAFTLRDAIKYGRGGGATPGGFTEYVGTASWNPFAIAGRRGNYREVDRLRDEAAIARQQKSLTENAPQVERRAENEAELLRSNQALLQLKQQMRAEEVEALKPIERRAAITEEISKLEKETARGNREAESYLRAWYAKRLENEREIAAVQKQAAMDNIKSAEQYIASIEQRIERVRSQTVSGAERFARMDPEEQQALLSNREQVQRGGAGGMAIEALDQLRGFSDPLDAQISEELQRRALRAGFGAFVSDAQKEIDQLSQVKRKLELEVKQQLQIVAKVDLDVEKVAREVAAKLQAINQKAVDEVANRVTTLTKEVNNIQTQILQRSVR